MWFLKGECVRRRINIGSQNRNGVKMSKVKLGIIGIGNMGTNHAKSIMGGKCPEIQLCAVADINPERLEWAKNEYKDEVTCFADALEMLDSGLIDACLIAVPHYDHCRFAIECIKRGIHVMVEKPAGVYTKQVREMNAEAEKHPEVVFGMMFNQRTNCVYRKMREMILGGEIGNIKRINWIITDWYRTQQYYDSGDWRASWSGEGGGVLFNQCPHQIDLLQWVTGMMPKTIHSHCHFGKWHDIEVEDDVTVYLEYENGATGSFITTTGDTPGTNRLEITGDMGTLICDGKTLVFKKLEVNEREFCKTSPEGFAKPKCEVIEVETDGQNPQHAGIINNFANAILGIEPLFVKGEDGLRGVELMDGMLLSSWLNAPVEMPFDDELYLDELKKRIATSRRPVEADHVVFSKDGCGDIT